MLLKTVTRTQGNNKALKDGTVKPRTFAFDFVEVGRPNGVLADGVFLSDGTLNVAILNIVFDAVNRAYQVVVPADAVAGTPVSYGDDVLRHTIRLLATVTTTADVVSAWAG